MGFCKLESRNNGVFILTMASTDEQNYLTDDAITDLVHTLEGVRNNSQVKGLVTTCDCRTFCAGLDYSDSNSVGQAEKLAERVAQVIRLLLQLPVPTVAALRGNATSLGLALALAHDHCFVWEHAELSLPEAKLGRPLPDYVAALLRDKLSFKRLQKLLMLKSETCTGKDLAKPWWSCHGVDGDWRAVLEKSIDLLYDVKVGDGACFAKTRQMLCAETSAAVGITIQNHIPRPSPAQLASDKAAKGCGNDDPKSDKAEEGYGDDLPRLVHLSENKIATIQRICSNICEMDKWFLKGREGKIELIISKVNWRSIIWWDNLLPLNSLPMI